MNEISKTEELILLTVWRLQDDAYGVTIRHFLQEITGKSISIGGIYVPLDRLVRKGYLKSFQSEPTSERGGMSKRMYKLTESGLEALNESKKVHDTLWENLPDAKVVKGD
ncbi:PadR family transcriptional regulator [candidate division KSB1 bacterium]